MSDCNAFTTREWKITKVTKYDEQESHVISIQPEGNKFAVKCKNHPKDYAKATCIGGVLKGDDGYEIRLTPGTRDRIDFKQGGDGTQAGSWTANDNSGDLSGS